VHEFVLNKIKMNYRNLNCNEQSAPHLGARM